jgi:hypothetical protein
MRSFLKRDAADLNRNALIARERQLSRAAATLLAGVLDQEDDEIGLFVLC